CEEVVDARHDLLVRHLAVRVDAGHEPVVRVGARDPVEPVLAALLRRDEERLAVDGELTCVALTRIRRAHASSPSSASAPWPNGSGSTPGSQLMPGSLKPSAFCSRFQRLFHLSCSRSTYRVPCRWSYSCCMMRAN